MAGIDVVDVDRLAGFRPAAGREVGPARRLPRRPAVLADEHPRSRGPRSKVSERWTRPADQR